MDNLDKMRNVSQDIGKDDSAMNIDEINEMEERRIKELNEAGIVEMDVIAQAREHLTQWENYFNENQTRGKDDMNFVLRDQWTAIERSEFTRLQKVGMTFNKLYDPIKKTLAEQRKNKPDLIVRSLTGEATQEQIDLRADLIRTISYQSQNDLVYQQAFKSALLMGWGAFQIDVDYENPDSFNQIIKYLLIPDAQRCSWDPNAIKPHKGDGNWCSIQHVMSMMQFNATFPYITNPVSYADPRMFIDFQWETSEGIVICDYYVKEWYPFKLLKLSNGMAVTESEWEKMQDKIKIRKALAEDSPVVGALLMREIPTVVATRQSQDYKIMHYRLLKNQIIDFREWPSKHLPIIFVDGDSYFIEGRQYTRSFIHEARDAQKCANYIGSEIITEIKNRRREQWLATPDNIQGQEQQWRNPELQIGALLARPDPKTGMMPMKQPAWEISRGLLEQYQRTTSDMKEILGFHEENEGAASNAMSGVAITNRAIAGSNSGFMWFDNLYQALEQGGRVTLDLLPYTHGGDERHMILNKQNSQSESIILNKKMEDGSVENELSKGDYDIEIGTGPTFAIQKQAALQLMMQLIQANPQVFPLIADLVAKNLDLQQMPLIASRLENMVPPQILAKERGEPPPPPQPNPEQQMAQMEMQEKQQKMQLEQKRLEQEAEDLKMRQEKHQLDKIRMLMEAKEMESKIKTNHLDKKVELHKADLDYSAQLAKIIGDIHQTNISASAKNKSAE
jgi:hypothetical protein